MSRATWNSIKLSKLFYVTTYRRLTRCLVGSLLLNILLFMIVCYVYLNAQERQFYATNGVIPPILLTPLVTPNYSNEALLPSESINDNNFKIIPQ